MIKQSMTFDDILEKKFKILRTSILLGNIRNKENTLSEYEDTAREIDKIRTSVYEELLGAKMYTTVTLEEEEERLKDLISFVEKRIKERNDFVDDYIKITSNFLDDLDKVSLESELASYKIRYSNIEEYLNNCEEIKRLNLKLKELRNELEEKYENKANNELINSKLEEELIDEFNKFISRNKYYSDLNYTDIDLELTKLEESLLEKKNVLDTFTSSYQALVSAGISGAEREEYSSYVQEARLNYYEDIERKSILNIYKLVLDKQVDYDKLYEKRLNIENILNDRNRIRENLGVIRRDELEFFVDLCKEQFSIIRAQKFNIETIDKLIVDISECENKLDELESANNRVEILELLNEFSVEVPEVEKIELPDEKKVYEEVEKNIEKKPSNMVVRVKDPIKINVKTATDTAKLVMKKVVIVLEPKKFADKRDKLKEAELELKKEKLELQNKEETNSEVEEKFQDTKDENLNILTEEKNIDSIEEENVESVEEIKNDKLNDNEIEQVVNTDSSEEVIGDIFEDIFVDNNKDKSDEVINTIDDMHDVFLDDDPDELGVELDTKEVFGDSSVKETKELTEIKINASDPSNMVIPTEIFIEDPPAPEEVDLFKVTDPFLDDNEFELNSSDGSGEIKSFMPTIGRIGTVKPNNALSKIENVVKDTADVTLPNLGLVEGTNKDVPIVSENYISWNNHV